MGKLTAKGDHRGTFRGARRVPGALLSVLLLAALLVACGGNEGGNGGGGDAAAPANTVGGGGAAEEPPITELSEIESASDKAALAGRWVRISEVDVLEVVNNHSVFVGTGEEERLFVSVQQIPRLGETTGGLEEQEQQGRRRIEEGQTLKVIGRIRPVPETADAALRRFGLTGEEFELLQDEEILIRAWRAKVVGGG